VKEAYGGDYYGMVTPLGVVNGHPTWSGGWFQDKW